MSNRVALQFTKFINIDEKGEVLDESLGYRIYDDYSQNYDNTFASLAELNSSINIGTLKDFISSNCDEFYDSVAEKGIWLNGDWIPAENIPGFDEDS